MSDLRAICFSEICNRKAKQSVKIGNTIGIEKLVGRDAWFCPDCKSALYWTREAKNSAVRHTTESGKQRNPGDVWAW